MQSSVEVSLNREDRQKFIVPSPKAFFQHFPHSHCCFYEFDATCNWNAFFHQV